MLRPDDGPSVPLRAAVLIALPNGWRGRWVITDTIRKVYAIATTSPTSDGAGEEP